MSGEASPRHDTSVSNAYLLWGVRGTIPAGNINIKHNLQFEIRESIQKYFLCAVEAQREENPCWVGSKATISQNTLHLIDQARPRTCGPVFHVVQILPCTSWEWVRSAASSGGLLIQSLSQIFRRGKAGYCQEIITRSPLKSHSLPTLTRTRTSPTILKPWQTSLSAITRR